MDYKNLYKTEAHGQFSFGIDIKISCPINMDLSGEIKNTGRKAAELIEQAIIREYHRTNKNSQERAGLEKEELVDCFPEPPILIEPVPNGYCSLACCEHLPWFKVTGRVGTIIIGWRKRVIQINWAQSLVQTPAEQLFPDEDVTKIGCLIHAWSYKKAKEYLAKIYAHKTDKKG